MTSRVFDVVIVGGGAGGIATAASLLQRRSRQFLCMLQLPYNQRLHPGTFAQTLSVSTE
jgi:NADH dehydrogenase FAD-containing subunit